ncbi:MAG: hypothetical protein M1830_001568 [Pleopsidium flavum]|nr:MAG: hypothetical protein M1830_001568 [Pleopsidium flavum]
MSIVPVVSQDLITSNSKDIQLRLWPELNSPQDPRTNGAGPASTLDWYLNINQGGRFVPSAGFFVSILPNGTATGVLREHALRLNSSISCNPIEETPQMAITPAGWNFRSDISEELFINVSVPHVAGSPVAPFSVHCVASTTRGYFELGNYFNGFSHQPILDKWPDDLTMSTVFNDHMDAWDNYSIPAAINYAPREELTQWGGNLDPFNRYQDDLLTPGPLLLSTISIFGNQSFFYTAAYPSNLPASDRYFQICQQGSLRFNGLLKNIGYSQCLDIGNILCKASTLTQTADATAERTARNIYSSNGYTTQKPTTSLAWIIIISILVSMQLAGLLYFGVYNCRSPSWTASLDALALARIGTSLKSGDLSPMRSIGDRDLEALNSIDGFIGLEDDDATGDSAEYGYRLGVGAPGFVRQDKT